MTVNEAFVLYKDGDFSGAMRIFQDHKDNLVDEYEKENCLFNIASCWASQGNVEKANGVLATIKSSGNDLLYNKALCQYHLGHFDKVIKSTSQIIKNILETKTEYSIDGVDISIREDIWDDEGKFEQLKSSLLIETLNIRAAALYKIQKDPSESKQCFDQLKIRNESKLDCVTLHNHAIYEATTSHNQSLDKLIFLIELRSKGLNKCVPKEAIYNAIAIMIALKYEDDFNKLLEEYESLIGACVNEELLQYIRLVTNTTSQSSIEIAENLERLIEKLCNRMNSLDPTVDVVSYRELNHVISIIFTHCASIRWRNNQYRALERLSKKVKLILIDNSLAIKVQAYSLFAQDTRYEEATELFEQYLAKSPNSNLLSIDPYLIGNLCVSYVLMGLNSEAEALIKNVEAETVQYIANSGGLTLKTTAGIVKGPNQLLTIQTPKHLNIINMIIGTLYCIKYNIEFGLMRVFKAVEPLDQNLDAELWSLTKRCILSILDGHCKQKLWLNDDLLDQIVTFLIKCELHGHNIDAYSFEGYSPVILNKIQHVAKHKMSNITTVTQEAKFLRSIILPIIHD